MPRPSKTSDLSQRYQKSRLLEEDAQKYLKKLLEYMQLEKPYLDSRLTLPKLAYHIGISSNYLSQIINSKLNRNFFDFVNKYRIEEIIKYINNPKKKNYTFLALAFEFGFNSKSVFNSAFKKQLGMTPSKYKKEVINKKQ